MTKKKKIALIFGIAIVAIYVIGILVFNNRIVPNTKIGEINLGMTKFDNVQTVVDQGFKQETIAVTDVVISDYTSSVTDLGASIDSAKLAKDLKTDQNSLIWPFELAAKSNYKLEDYITVDQEVLASKLEADKFFEQEGRTKAQDASLKLNEETVQYEVVEAVPGTVIDEKLFITNMTTAISNLAESIDTADSYIQPQNDVDTLNKQASALNDRINRNVSMTIGDETIQVPKDIIARAVYIDEDGKVAVEGSELYNYLYDQSLEFDSDDIGVGYRTITESNVDPAYEEIVNGLISDDNADIVADAPVDETEDTFKPTVKTDEETYIEISIPNQVMWVYKDGELLLQTPVVTGSQADGWDTPTGEYTIIDKETDKVLNGSSVGFDYEVPVNYWMRLTNSGIGIHDIDWLNSGNAWDSRDVYELQGSHGCINVPNDVMKTVYDNIPVGTPVYVTG